MTTDTPNPTRRRLVAAWLVSLAATVAITAAGTAYAILAHGDVLGAPLVMIGGKVMAASEPVVVQQAATILPLPGELDTPMPTPAARRAQKDAGTKLARR